MGVIRHNTWLVYQTHGPRATSRAKVTEHVNCGALGLEKAVARERGLKSDAPARDGQGVYVCSIPACAGHS